MRLRQSLAGIPPRKYGDTMDSCDEGFYKYWFGGALEAAFPDWPT
jgi:hypothetical protein